MKRLCWYFTIAANFGICFGGASLLSKRIIHHWTSYLIETTGDPVSKYMRNGVASMILSRLKVKYINGSVVDVLWKMKGVSYAF